jgi:hypothetical protein
VLNVNASLADMSSILDLSGAHDNRSCSLTEGSAVSAPPCGVFSPVCADTFGLVKQPAPLRVTGQNEDGTHAVSVNVDVRVSDWEALRAGLQEAADEPDGVALTDAAVLALAIAESVSNSTLPAGMELCHVHVNYLRAAVARDVPASD